MARRPLSWAPKGDASPLIKRRVQAAVPQLHLGSNGFARKLESSARIPRFHTSVEAVTPPWRCRRESVAAGRVRGVPRLASPRTPPLRRTSVSLATARRCRAPWQNLPLQGRRSTDDIASVRCEAVIGQRDFPRNHGPLLALTRWYDPRIIPARPASRACWVTTRHLRTTMPLETRITEAAQTAARRLDGKSCHFKSDGPTTIVTVYAWE